MKRIFTLLIVAASSSLFGQESQFMGYFSPTTAELVPTPKGQDNPKNQVIKPNFKGRELIEVDNSQTHNPDWVWQQHEVANQQKTLTATILWSKPGLGVGISPPDPSVDADSTVAISGTNSGGGAVYRIFNRSTGATVGSSSYTMRNLVNAGAITGAGDPIILYYKPARRWFLTEFSSSGNRLLVYVSQTSNPQGAYYRYAFTCTNFPDYPKYGFSTTSDAFLVSTNEGGPPTVYAMKLSALLAGTTSPFIKRAIGYSLNGFGFQSITPVDLEGDNAAPAGMKPLFVRHRDDESHSNGTPDSGSNDWIELWEMDINWTNNTATTTKIQDISIAEIDSKLCGLTSFQCIKQPGTTSLLDPLREPVMYKAPMRVFDTHQAMVLCLSTDVDGADRAGVRWIELRRPTGVITPTWTKYQEGTYAPGTSTSRWMPAINIDKHGNILMAYSTSSNAAGDFPSIKMTGRKPCDPLGTMTMAETTIIAGANSKISNGDTRWGDYHHMAIDDFDGETFYYAGVYQQGSNTASGTKTNVSAIKFNPDVNDATISEIFQVISGNVCGASTQLGVVVENRGTTAITSGVIQWQVGTGALTNVNYTSNQLNSLGATDTVFVTVSGLVNGANTVTINTTTVNGVAPDDNVCNDTKTLAVTVSSGSGLTSSSTINSQPTCNGNQGEISISAIGGTAPFTYALNNGTPQANGTFSNLAAGNYTYTITDNIGCTGTGTINLLANVVITVNPSQTGSILCFGNQSGAISVNASGGNSSYTYSIDGTNYVSSTTFTSLTAGTYTVYAKDGNNCVGQSTVTITEPTALNLNAIPTMITCNGSDNGIITAAGNGGTLPYQYSLDGTNFFSLSTINNLSAGSYTVTVKDANGCLKTFTTSITEPTAVVANAFSTASTGTNGTITASATGGLTPYTYSINGTNYFSGSLFSNLAPGTYTIYAKDNNGCISTFSVVVESTIGLEEFDGTFQVVKLYPNPNNGIFELEVNGIVGNDLTCKLFNINGQEVSSFKVDVVNGKASKTIEMSRKLAAGSYYLGIYNGNKAIVKQFIKE